MRVGREGCPNRGGYYKAKLGDAMADLLLEQTLEAQVVQLERPLAEKDASFALDIDLLRLQSSQREAQESLLLFLFAEYPTQVSNSDVSSCGS